MHTVRKRVTVSLPGDLLDRIDRHARARRLSRSRVIEDWLRAASRGATRAALAAEAETYYGSQPAAERAEDDAIAEAASVAATELDLDESPPGPSPTPRRRTR